MRYRRERDPGNGKLPEGRRLFAEPLRTSRARNSGVPARPARGTKAGLGLGLILGARVGGGSSSHAGLAPAALAGLARRPRRTVRTWWWRRRRAGLELDRPEAQHAIRDLQRMVELLEQRVLALELEQVVAG